MPANSSDRYVQGYRDFMDPEKHWVRSNMWLPALRRLYDELERPIKYFTLPGMKALDVKLFSQKGLIRATERGCPEVCFCDKDPRNYAGAKKLLGNTKGVMSTFEDMILAPHVGRHRPFWDLFPYDAYNLDFCGTCMPGDEPPFSTTFQSLHELMRRHSVSLGKRRADARTPFLLFVTVKASKSETNQEAVQQLKQNIEDNRAIDDVSPLVGSLVGEDTDAFVDSNYHLFLLASVPKFMAHLGIQTRTTVEIDGRAFYRRPKGYHIVKFVFRCSHSQPTLRINSPTYLQCVRSAFDLGDAKHVTRRSMSRRDRDRHQAFIRSVQ